MKTQFRIPVMLCMAAMLATIFVVSCSKDDVIPPPDLTALKASIAAAQDVVSKTVEGKNDGQYPAGSKNTLNAAIAQAQAIVDSGGTLQEEVDAAKASLDLAVTTYQGLVITPIAKEALIAHWSFDEGTGTTANDDSDNHFNGTFKKGPENAPDTSWKPALPTWTTDRTGAANKAVHFNGGNIEVPYNAALNPTNAMTVSVWAKQDKIKAGNRFLGLQSWIGYKFEFQDHAYPFFSLGYNGGTYDRDSGQEVPVNTWHQVAVTFTPGHMIFYVDGTKIKEYADVPNPGFSISAKPYNLVIGQDFPTDKYYMGDPGNGANFNDPSKADQYQVIPVAWGGFFKGSLDELRMYNTALTATQISQLYDREKP
jgi:hypothetical protein